MLVAPVAIVAVAVVVLVVVAVVAAAAVGARVAIFCCREWRRQQRPVLYDFYGKSIFYERPPSTAT